MAGMMHALVKNKPEPGLWLEQVPIPTIGINDVLIKIEKTAICGTDVHIYKWNEWARQTIPVPMVTGHEFVGRVAAVGSNVHDFAPGDLVSGEGHLVCGRCRNCLAGRRHLCNKTSGVGVNRPGCFAEYLAIPVTNVWHCDPAIATDILCCFDPLGNATHTALSFNCLGEDVLITGAGPIGCMATAIVRHAGARHVVVTDIVPYRLELARKMGATLALDAHNDSLAEAQEKLGMKEGFDIGLEMSGTAEALQQMLGSMPRHTSVDWDAVVFNGLTLKGIYGREMYETWYKMTVMIQSGLDIAPVITHRFHYTEYEKGFAAMLSGQSGKVILSWNA